MNRAACRAVSRFIEMTAGAGVRPAMAVVKHTYGEGVRFHPHLYALVTSGGWDRSRVWHPLPMWDQSVLRELFEIEVFRFLRERELLSRERMEPIRKVWQEEPLLRPRCGGTMRIISFITDQTVIDKILRHIRFKRAYTPPRKHLDTESNFP